jgi:sulfatase modifying factor 1
VSCPAARGGPAFVPVPLATGVGGYCIEATEVTRNQYAAFLQSNPSTATQQMYCSANTTFTPSSDWPPTASDGDLPITWVTWCDAYAFCQWVGGHLCGGINGMTYNTMYLSDATVSEWYNACSAGGGRTYPYGATYEAQACNGHDYKQSGGDGGTHAAVPVGSLPACEGGENGLYDMSGNVFEWENACLFDSNNPMGSQCTYRGGDYESSEEDLNCSNGLGQQIQIGSQLPTVGFRCCANPGTPGDAGPVPDAMMVADAGVDAPAEAKAPGAGKDASADVTVVDSGTADGSTGD